MLALAPPDIPPGSPPNLTPLLERMHAQADGKGRVVSLPRKKMAHELRMHLRRAGVVRAELLERDATRRPLSFHDAGRATGITWMALRGDDPLRIQRRAGHADFNTTQGYIREAEALGRDVGEPFPPLPESLLGEDILPRILPNGMVEFYRSMRNS